MFLVIILSVLLSKAVDSLLRRELWIVLLASVLMLTLVLAVVFIWRQPQSKTKASFMVNRSDGGGHSALNAVFHALKICTYTVPIRISCSGQSVGLKGLLKGTQSLQSTQVTCLLKQGQPKLNQYWMIVLLSVAFNFSQVFETHSSHTFERNSKFSKELQITFTSKRCMNDLFKSAEQVVFFFLFVFL